MKGLKLLIFVLFIVIFHQCDNTEKIIKKYKTKNEFKYKYNLSPSVYSADSLMLAGIFREMINRKVSPYSSKMFDEKTKIIIDSIIYDPDRNYTAIFVIMKIFNGSMRFRGDMNPNAWHFDGTIHFAEKTKDSLENKYCWKIFDYHGTDHINGESYAQISEIVRIENLAGRSYAAHKYNYEGYNVDDYRFWTSEAFECIKNGGYNKLFDNTDVQNNEKKK